MFVQLNKQISQGNVATGLRWGGSLAEYIKASFGVHGRMQWWKDYHNRSMTGKVITERLRRCFIFDSQCITDDNGLVWAFGARCVVCVAKARSRNSILQEIEVGEYNGGGLKLVPASTRKQGRWEIIRIGVIRSAFLERNALRRLRIVTSADPLTVRQYDIPSIIHELTDPTAAPASSSSSAGASLQSIGEGYATSVPVLTRALPRCLRILNWPRMNK